MRIAEGGQHPTEVCGDILHDEDERHVFFLSCGRQNEKSEGQEGQERHVVADQHRPKERDINQCDGGNAKIACAVYDLSGEDGEELNIFECADDCERAKQAGQRFPVKIIGVLRIGRHDTGRRDGKDDCNAQNDVFADEGKQLFHEMMKP